MREDDEILSDYFDGRLAPAERKAFEARLAADAALARRLRLLGALRDSLKRTAPPMPAALKAALKREARSRAARSSYKWTFDWRFAFGGVFAAAALVLAARLALPGKAARQAAPGAAKAWKDGEASKALDRLWSDDNGGDGDEG